MRSIAKISLANTPDNREPVGILIPKGSSFAGGRISEMREIETGAAQYDMWFVVDTDEELEKIYFQTILTGSAFPKGGFYLGTYEVVPGIDLHVLKVPAPAEIAE